MKFLMILLFSLNCYAAKNPRVIMKTTKGEIEIELNQKKAPITVKNFLSYVKSKHFEGTIFHRVIDNFMIQGGGFDTNLKKLLYGVIFRLFS